MTNPDRDELVKLADTITGHVAALANEPLRMSLTTWNVVSNDILAAAESLRRLASSDGGVKGEPEPVAWRWRYDDEYAWSLRKDRPSHADVRDVICEPLYTAPPADAGMREALAYAERLAIALWSKHFKESAPEWKPLSGNLIGLLTQIDNMTAALTAPGATTKSDGASRPCTCHPDDKPPEPCPQKFAYTECVEATKPSDPSSTRSEVTPNERFAPRMLALDDMHAVCVGGRWDGWKFYKHPDGQWVSLEKLNEVRP